MVGDRLPNGGSPDWQQFQETYERNTLYFADPTGKTVFRILRYVAVRPRPAGHGASSPNPAGGSTPEMARTQCVICLAPLPATARAGDSRRRKERNRPRQLAARESTWRSSSTTDPHSRQLLCRIPTLARVYQMTNADGAPLEDRLAEGGPLRCRGH